MVREPSFQGLIRDDIKWPLNFKVKLMMWSLSIRFYVRDSNKICDVTAECL